MRRDHSDRCPTCGGSLAKMVEEEGIHRCDVEAVGRLEELYAASRRRRRRGPTLAERLELGFLMQRLAG